MAVLTPLSFATGLVALHMDSWQTVVSDIVQLMTERHDPAVQNLPCLLELLSILPEVAGNYNVVVCPIWRERVRLMLQESRSTVLQLLCALNSPLRARHDLMQSMLKCAASWVHHVQFTASELAQLSTLNHNCAGRGSLGLLEVATNFRCVLRERQRQCSEELQVSALASSISLTGGFTAHDSARTYSMSIAPECVSPSGPSRSHAAVSVAEDDRQPTSGAYNDPMLSLFSMSSEDAQHCPLTRAPCDLHA